MSRPTWQQQQQQRNLQQRQGGIHTIQHGRAKQPRTQPQSQGCLATLLLWVVGLAILVFMAYFLIVMVSAYG
jgi:hypothetical protein